MDPVARGRFEQLSESVVAVVIVGEDTALGDDELTTPGHLCVQVQRSERGEEKITYELALGRADLADEDVVELFDDLQMHSAKVGSVESPTNWKVDVDPIVLSANRPGRPFSANPRERERERGTDFIIGPKC